MIRGGLMKHVLVGFVALFHLGICDEKMAERHEFFCSDSASIEEKVKVLECMEEDVPEKVNEAWGECVDEHFADIKDDKGHLIETFCKHEHEEAKTCFKTKMDTLDHSDIAEIHVVFEKCRDD